MKNQIFRFDKKDVRTVQKDDDTWFVAKDVCGILGMTDTSKSLSRLDEDEKSVASVRTLGGAQELLIVSESGLYSLILTSRKPEAKKFKKWVTSEVLPAIRKTGGYVSNDEQFISQYLPFADDDMKEKFRNTLVTIQKQNRMIEAEKNNNSKGEMK